MSAAPAAPALTRIRAGGPSLFAEVGEAWRHRELLRTLCARELRVRHNATLLGAAWMVVQPLLVTLTFTVFMSRVAGVPSDGTPYVLFACAGLLPWLFFSNGVQTLAYALLMHGPLLTRTYFPRLLIPASMVVVRLLDLSAGIAVTLLLLPWHGLPATGRLLLLPLLALQAAVLTGAVGAWLSCLVIRYRDFGTLLPVVLQAGLFATPVIYPSSLVPDAWRPLYRLNPLAGLVDGFRSALLGRPFDVPALAVSLAVTVFASAACLAAFVHMQDRAVDAL